MIAEGGGSYNGHCHTVTKTKRKMKERKVKIKEKGIIHKAVLR